MACRGSLWPESGSRSPPSLLPLLALPQLLLFSGMQAEYNPRTFAWAMSRTYITLSHQTVSVARAWGGPESLDHHTPRESPFPALRHSLMFTPREGGWAEDAKMLMLEIWGDLEPPLLLIPPPLLFPCFSLFLVLSSRIPPVLVLIISICSMLCWDVPLGPMCRGHQSCVWVSSLSLRWGGAGHVPRGPQQAPAGTEKGAGGLSRTCT